MATVHGLEDHLQTFISRFKARFENLVRILSTPDVSEASILQVMNGYVLNTCRNNIYGSVNNKKCNYIRACMVDRNYHIY